MAPEKCGYRFHEKLEQNCFLEWNLANNSQFKPHTEGGCNMCKGAITINSSENFERNVGYYIIAHASKFVPQNSVRIAKLSVRES